MSDEIELPPLPEPDEQSMANYGIKNDCFSWDAMEDYARAAIEADRIKRDDYINDDRDQLRAEIVALKGTIADLEADRERRAQLTAAGGRDELARALTDLCDEIDKHPIHSTISSTSIHWFKRKAREALAAYRKGGDV